MTKGIRTPIILHVCYGYALVFKDKTPSPDYPELLELAASCPEISAISLEYEQPGHEPELLRHCGEKHVLLGLLNLATDAIETPEHIASRIRHAASVIPPERLHPCSDCGMWYLPRDRAFGKILALTRGAAIIRAELDLDA